MKRLNTHVSTMQATLQQRPEILFAVRMNHAAHVLFSMIDNSVVVFVLKTSVTGEFIGIEFGTLTHVLFYEALQSGNVAVLYYLRSHLRRASIISTLQAADDNNFVNSSPTLTHLLTFR